MHNELLLQKTFKAMGGEFKFECYPQEFHSKSDVLDIFEKASSEVNRIESKFTDFQDSEFNKINGCAGDRPCVVDSEIFDLVTKSIELSKKSNGLFDISYASIGHAWRDAKKNGVTLSMVKRKELLELVNYKKIVISKGSSTIFLPHKDMRIGLGGIGKGYAVDRAYDVLKEHGLYNFYINGSGDIRVYSHQNAPRLWRIGIQNPLSNDKSKFVGTLQIAEGGVATSGSYMNKVDNEIDELDHHIINPRSGKSKNSIISTTIFSSTCLEADTTATILMNMDTQEAVRYMNKHQIFGALIDKSGKTFLSKKALSCFG